MSKLGAAVLCSSHLAAHKALLGGWHFRLAQALVVREEVSALLPEKLHHHQ
jgi:hypothetical protein